MELGKVSESVLKRSVLKYVQLNNKQVQNGYELCQSAQVGADFALIKDTNAEKSRMAIVTQIAIGRKRTVLVEAMVSACNSLSCSGATPVGVELSLVLPEALYESELRHMMEDASAYATSNRILICGGHTTVSKFVTETIATVTAFGTVSDFEPKTMEPGMDVVISKWIGLQGTAQIASLKAEELEKRLPARFVAEAKSFEQFTSIMEEANIAKQAQVYTMHDASGGGIFRALWELAEFAGTGIRIELKKIPIRQETVEVCEVFGLNPYELLSGGALLMVTPNGEALVEKLLDADIPATLIGQLTGDKDKVLVTYGEDGEELRYLDKPRNDEIDKIL